MLDSPFLAVTVLGIGGLALGLLRLLVAALRSSWRAGPVDGFLLAGWAAAVACCGFPFVVWLPAMGIALVLISPFAWKNKRIRQVCISLVGLLTHSAFQAMALAGLGLSLVFWFVQASSLENSTDAW